MKIALRGTLARNTVWNLVGLSIPLAILLFAVPALIRNFGNERFGLLAILWTLIGYAGLADLGLPRALTHAVARAKASVCPRNAALVSANGLACLGCVGGIAAVFLFLASGTISGAIDLSPNLRGELLVAMWIGSLTLPLVLVNAGLLGVLEAHGRFDYSNACRILVAIVAIGGAALVSFWCQRLWVGVLTLTASRTLAVLLAGTWLRRIDRQGISTAEVSWIRMCDFVRAARWLTASSLLGPVLGYGDRIVLLALVSAATLAWYVTPYEVVTKLLVVATSVGSAVFPTFSSSTQDDSAKRRVFWRAFCLVALGLLPPVVVCVAFAKPALATWISTEFSKESSAIAQVLCLGVLWNGLAAVPFAYLQGIGRARTVAYIHLAEAPFYLTVLVLAAQRHGVEGVAYVWAGRMLLDFLLLMIVTMSELKSLKRVTDHAT